MESIQSRTKLAKAVNNETHLNVTYQNAIGKTKGLNADLSESMKHGQPHMNSTGNYSDHFEVDMGETYDKQETQNGAQTKMKRQSNGTVATEFLESQKNQELPVQGIPTQLQTHTTNYSQDQFATVTVEDTEGTGKQIVLQDQAEDKTEGQKILTPVPDQNSKSGHEEQQPTIILDTGDSYIFSQEFINTDRNGQQKLRHIAKFQEEPLLTERITIQDQSKSQQKLGGHKAVKQKGRELQQHVSNELQQMNERIQSLKKGLMNPVTYVDHQQKLNKKNFRAYKQNIVGGMPLIESKQKSQSKQKLAARVYYLERQDHMIQKYNNSTQSSPRLKKKRIHSRNRSNSSTSQSGLVTLQDKMDPYMKPVTITAADGTIATIRQGPQVKKSISELKMPLLEQKAQKSLIADFETLAKKHNLTPRKAARLLNVNLDKSQTLSKKFNMDSSGATIIHNINITSNNIYGPRGGSELDKGKQSQNIRLPQQIISEHVNEEASKPQSKELLNTETQRDMRNKLTPPNKLPKLVDGSEISEGTPNDGIPQALEQDNRTEGCDQSSVESQAGVNTRQIDIRKKKKRRKQSKGEKFFPKVEQTRGTMNSINDYPLTQNPRSRIAQKRFSNQYLSAHDGSKIKSDLYQVKTQSKTTMNRYGGSKQSIQLDQKQNQSTIQSRQQQKFESQYGSVRNSKAIIIKEMYDPNFEKIYNEEPSNRFKRDEKRHKIKISLNHSKLTGGRKKQDSKSQKALQEFIDVNVTPKLGARNEGIDRVNTLETLGSKSPISAKQAYSPRIIDQESQDRINIYSNQFKNN